MKQKKKNDFLPFPLIRYYWLGGYGVCLLDRCVCAERWYVAHKKKESYDDQRKKFMKKLKMMFNKNVKVIKLPLENDKLLNKRIKKKYVHPFISGVRSYTSCLSLFSTWKISKQFNFSQQNCPFSPVKSSNTNNESSHKRSHYIIELFGLEIETNSFQVFSSKETKKNSYLYCLQMWKKVVNRVYQTIFIKEI